MNKASLNIPAQDGKWGSYVSKYPPDSNVVGASAFTAGSRNVITAASGQAEKRQGGIIWNPASLLSGPALDQFEGVFSTGQRLFIVNDAGTLKASTGNGVFATITGGTGFTNPANFEFVTYQNRIYGCNGVDAPIVIDVATSYGGVTYATAPAKIRPMGSTAPASAPTAGAPSSGGAIPAGAHTYKVTYLYYNGIEESNPSAASSVQTAAGPNFTIGLSAIPVGGYGVTGRNIYRDNNDGNYLLLDSILDNTTTTYSDTKLIGSTPISNPLLNFGPPVFKYCILYLDRIFVIDIAGKNIYWSLAGEPDVFYPQNAISGPPDDIMTGFGMLNGIPYVFGQHTVGTILGTTDSSFYYNSLSTHVGCVDNRSIQTRLIVSVPTLMWLSALPNRGIYYTNGSIIQHMSDNIQDLTFTLAQISYLSRLNSQASQADFQGGTSSPGIDLLTNPGTIQTINPKALYSHAADWQAGTLSNLATVGDSLQVPTAFTPSAASGALAGSAVIAGGNVSLPTSSGSGETSISNLQAIATGSTPQTGWASSFTPSKTTTISSMTLYSLGASTFSIWSDGGGLPGTLLYSSAVASAGQTTKTPNLSVVAGVKYWCGYTYASASTWVEMGFASHSANAFAILRGSVWAANNPATGGSISSTVAAASYSLAAVSDTGTWTSPIYDSLCSTQTAGMAAVVSASYPASTSASLVVQGSTNGTTWVTTDTLASPSGTVAMTGGAYRYWHFILTVSTSDNLNVPLVGPPTLTFNTTGTWTSPAILCTADMTAFNALVQTVMVPAGTTAAILLATSASIGSGYSSFVAVGSAAPNKYAKIQVTLTANTGDITSALLSAVEMDWTVVSTFISSAIDAGSVPNGWGIFQYDHLGSLGTIAASFRTAATSGGLAAASFAAIANGGFPTNTVFQYFEYKFVLTATADNIPQVTTVTTNWFLSTGNNVRAASLFFNKSYYLAVATTGSLTNNLLIEYDFENNWRIHDGVTIGTMATYFNDIFYCDALNGKIYNGFQSVTDNGTPIVMRLRTKAYDLGDNLKMKTARSLKLTGVNTGTLVTVSYSVDRGSTWNIMRNSSGTLSYQTASDLSQFIEYFIPNFDGTVPVSGRTIMYEILSSDAFPCVILQIAPTVYVHKGKAVREAMAA